MLLKLAKLVYISCRNNMSAQTNDLINPQVLLSLTKYLRLANYLSTTQMYLKDNYLLESELKREHLKERVLGHWGTVPGINFIYANLNLLIKRHQQETMLITGPGHGYPALLANLYIEGTLGDYYPDYKWGKYAMGKLSKNFSWPRQFPSHANPETPGVILEGGELGYALAYAFGAAFDNPDLLVACIVGDGEAETATTAASWHSNKFLNPKNDGAVLPIVHINKFKISGPSIFGTMSNEELCQLYKGYGYHPIIVEGDFLFEPMIYALEEAYQKIKTIQTQAREHGIIDKPAWPVILLISKKGWTGPKEVNGKMIEDSFYSHGVPLEHTLTEDAEFAALKQWLESYNISELITENGEPISEILSLVPEAHLRMGKNKAANGEEVAKLVLPDPKKFEVEIGKPASHKAANLIELSKYLEEVVSNNRQSFRLMSPDESISNRLGSLFNVTERCYMWPTPKGSEKIGPDGRVMEILSENILTAWMQGYTLTGRHSILVTYEAFMMIAASMVDQYLKFIKQKNRIYWRKAVPSLNFIITSATWRQEHNGLSHQNPGFVSSLMDNNSKHVDIHYPVDANMLIKTMEQCLNSRNMVNVIVAGKHDMPQYLTMQECGYQMKDGIGIWDGASNGAKDPDVVMAATGDYMTIEVLAAIKLLEQWAPEVKTRFVSVTEISNFNIGDLSAPGKNSNALFNHYFTSNKPIIWAYHGYPEDIKSLLFANPASTRIKLYGYAEKGTTTTPFDMLVLNKMSRYQLALDAAAQYRETHPDFEHKFQEILKIVQDLLAKHEAYIAEHGKDLAEVSDLKLLA